jgi:hypothetical protein
MKFRDLSVDQIKPGLRIRSNGHCGTITVTGPIWLYVKWDDGLHHTQEIIDLADIDVLDSNRKPVYVHDLLLGFP